MERAWFIGVVAVLTYLTRFAGFQIGDRKLHPDLDHFLTYVPITAFAALAVPGIAEGTGEFPARLAGSAAAAAIAVRFGHLWAGIVAGMAGFWLTGLLFL